MKRTLTLLILSALWGCDDSTLSAEQRDALEAGWDVEPQDQSAGDRSLSDAAVFNDASRDSALADLPPLPPPLDNGLADASAEIFDVTLDVAVPDVELDVAVPDVELDVAVPDVELDVAVPDVELDVAVPDVERDAEIPDMERDAEIPDVELDAAIPDMELDAEIPDAELDSEIPDVELDAQIPDVELDAAIPDVELDAQIPDAEPYDPPFDPTVCGAPSYAWLPPSDVGEALTWTPAEFPVISREMIQVILSNQDIGDLEFNHGARIYKLRYTTQDQGRLREATAMVAAPLDWVEAEPPPTVLWLHGTSGFSDGCAPSADFEMGIGQVALLAALGYVAIAPDYTGMLGFGAPSPEGTGHPYLVGESVALNGLDALRAARPELEAEAGALSYTVNYDRLLFWGGSQGGHAAFFTELYQPYYAPALAPLAVVAMVPPTDLMGLAGWGLSRVGATSGALAAAMTLMWDWYGRGADLGEVFINEPPEHAAENIFDWLLVCDGSATPLDDISTLEGLFTPALLDSVAAGEFELFEPWSCYTRENTVGRGAVPRISDTPFFVTLSGDDTLVITEVIRDHLPVLCEQGYDMEIIECAGLGHSQGAQAAIPRAHRWLQDRLAEAPQDPADLCVIPAPIDCLAP